MDGPLQMVDSGTINMTYNGVPIKIRRAAGVTGMMPDLWTASIHIDGAAVYTAGPDERAEVVQLAKDFINKNKGSF